MKSWRARLLVSAVCLILGILLVPQFRSQPVNRNPADQSPEDQVTYISQLYRSNETQRASLDALRADIAKYDAARIGGSSNLSSLINDLQQMKMLNGEVDITGPGVQVRINSTTDAVQVLQDLQDLTNELRASGAEAIAINDVRLISRSVITADADGHLLVDKQQISPPYLLEAIGDPTTLNNALIRKGGLIEVLQQDQGDKIEIKVVLKSDPADPIKLRKTALDLKWRYAKPVSGN